MLDSQPLDLKIARQALKQFWGYDQFRPPQEDIVSCLLAGQDALVLLPTGGGKSICFQLPALLRPGLTLVVSPLVSLMENQVQELRQRQIKAAVLHRQLSPQLRSQTLNQLQRLDLLYLSPESLLSSTIWPRLRSINISFLIIDEAHCISQWGTSFRPIYRRLGAVRSVLQQDQAPISVAAFTATATPKIQQEIQAVLRLQRPRVFRVSPYRANLNLQVQVAYSLAHRRRRVLKLIQHAGPSSGLIYTRSRRESEGLVDWLCRQQVRSVAYHAGLPPKRRRQIEAGWLAGAMPVVVCTSAFGMGINKPDCRWICHFQAPLSVAAYVQEIGRAGRDGMRSQTLLLVSEPTGWLDPQDQQQQHYFIRQQRLQLQQAQRSVTQLPTQGTLTAALQRSVPHAEMALSILHSMGQLRWIDPFRYVMTADAVPRLQTTHDRTMGALIRTRHCRWRWILEYFGFAAATFRCGHCDRCRSKAG